MHRVVTDCGKCNGVLVAPDQKTLYVIGNDNGWFNIQTLQEGEKTLQGAHQLQAYDLSPEGQASNRRVLIDYTRQDKPCSGPDGMVADTEGNIWLASRCEWRPGIQALSPTGKELAYISTGKELPIILISTSGGARMYEGMFSLMQMAKTCAALAYHAQARLPYISVLTDPTMAGVMASFATVGDIILAEPGAMIGFAGPRVIKDTTQAELPPGFQTAEFLLDHGLIDSIVPRKEMKPRLIDYLNYLSAGQNPG